MLITQHPRAKGDVFSETLTGKTQIFVSKWRISSDVMWPTTVSSNYSVEELFFCIYFFFCGSVHHFIFKWFTADRLLLWHGRVVDTETRADSHSHRAACRVYFKNTYSCKKNYQTDNWSVPTFGPKTQRLFIYCEKWQRKAENLEPTFIVVFFF